MIEMTGEIVFVMLIVCVVFIALICTRRAQEHDLKLEEMERKRRMEGVAQREKDGKVGNRELSVQEKAVQEKALQDEEKIEALRETLLETERQLWEVEIMDEYEQIFNVYIIPMQVLLGLDESSWDILTKDQIEYYMWDVVKPCMVDTLKMRKGKIVDGKIVIPVSKKKFDREKMKKKIERLEESELEHYIQENKCRLELKRVVWQKVNAIQELGKIVEELKGMGKDRNTNKEVVHDLAQRVQLILEKNEIYPMFIDDKRLKNYPKLRRGFFDGGENSIRYPGFFIERDGLVDVFGASVGSDH